MKKKVIIVVGSNFQNPRKNVTDAIAHLERYWKVSQKSEIYSTPDFIGGGKEYYNAVVEFETEEDIEHLNKSLKAYERSQGRNNKMKQDGKVPIDIDIVVYDGSIVRPKDFHTKYFKIGYNQLESTSTTPGNPVEQ